MANRKSASGLTHKGTNVLGVEFAPLHVPWERRMQTLAILFWLVVFLVTLLGSVVLFGVLLLSPLFFIPLTYLAWMIYDRDACNRNGRRIEWIRNLTIWKYYRDYFPVKLVKTCELDPKRNYLICVHPHGLLSTGAFTCFATEANDVTKVFPGLTMHLLTLERNFWLPITRDLFLAFGFGAASKKGMNHLLSHPGGGKGVVLIPGGAPEALETHPGLNAIQLERRKGFIKMALQNGSPLVPVFSYGETDIYDQVRNPRGSFLRKIQDKIQSLIEYAPVLVLGRGIFQYSFGPLPFRKPITTVVGFPIEVDKVAEPTSEQIYALHDKYVEALKDLFYTHRDKYASPDCKIKII